MSSGREIVPLSPSDARRTPWKNGGGVTDELALWPRDAQFTRGDFEWRISRARMTKSGPFSSFPGFERVLVLVDGPGAVLSHGDDAPRARLRRLEPYAFSGDWSTHAEISAPISDFNVIAHASVWRPSVEALPLGARRVVEELAPGHAFVHVLDGEAVARISDEEEPLELGAGDSVWLCELDRPAQIELQGSNGGCELLLVRLEPR